MVNKFHNETITRDPIFGHIFAKEENCLYLLQQLFPSLEIKAVQVIPKKEINEGLNERNTRFDIWAKTPDGIVFDLEMQTTKEFMPGTRFRYYQSENDKETLPPGAKFYEIKPSYIISFCPFDSVGNGKYIYEAVTLQDKDDIKSIMRTKAHWYSINSQGYEGQITPGLKDFLDYMNGKINRKNRFIKKIDSEVTAYVHSKEWRDQDMSIDLMLADKEHEVQMDDIKFLIKSERELNVPDQTILEQLMKKYNKTFDQEDLEELMKETNKN